MKIRICTTDSGTGEEMVIDADVNCLCGTDVAMAIDQYTAKSAGDVFAESISTHTVNSFVISPDGKMAAFVMSCVEPYFGFVLVAGIIYTQFDPDYNQNRDN
jgi:hypothetical protein